MGYHQNTTQVHVKTCKNLTPTVLGTIIDNIIHCPTGVYSKVGAGIDG